MRWNAPTSPLNLYCLQCRHWAKALTYADVLSPLCCTAGSQHVLPCYRDKMRDKWCPLLLLSALFTPLGTRGEWLKAFHLGNARSGTRAANGEYILALTIFLVRHSTCSSFVRPFKILNTSFRIPSHAWPLATSRAAVRQTSRLPYSGISA